MHKKIIALAGCLSLASLVACDEDDADEVVFDLQLLHFADMDSNESIALEAVENFSALVDGFKKDETYGANTIVVSSGDNIIPGPRWFAAENTAVRSLTGSNEPGHVDHFFMNEFGVAASALGNHDLDQGPGEFSDALKTESFTPEGGEEVTFGASFPYLAANVDFSGDEDLAARTGVDGRVVSTLAGKVAASANVRVGGEVIGLVGASTPELPNITTTGALTIRGSVQEIAELAAEIQPAVDALIEGGLNKIILLTHLQNINYEKALAKELSGVDIIVAGGSNTRMGNADVSDLYPGDEAFC